MNKERVKGSIFGKMMKGILLPLLAVLLVVGAVTTLSVEKALNEAKATEMESIAELGGSRVDGFFTKYREMARQMASGRELQQLLTEVKQGQTIGEAQSYPEFLKTMTVSAANDPANILVTWIADFDSSQFAESSGYVTEVGEWDVTTRVWYDQVRNAKDVVMTEPYENSSTNSLVVSVLAPVFAEDGNEILGVAGVDLNITNLQSMVAGMAFGETGYFVMVSEGGMIITSPDADMVQKSVNAAYDAQTAQRIAGGQTGPARFTYQGAARQGYITAVGSTGWKILASMTDREYQSDYVSLRNIILAIFAAAIAVVVAGNILISKSIIRPITGIAHAAEQIAAGGLDVKVDVKIEGETGQVANALIKTIGRLKDYIAYIDEVTDVLNRIAGGDLTFELEQEYVGEFSKIKEALLNISSTLTKTMLNIEQASQKVTGGSDSISAGAQQLSQGTTDQAASVEELQATIADISDRIESNAQHAVEASDKSAQLKDSVHQCNEQMRKMVEAMQEISAASDQIHNVIGTIEEIARQTSLLSLNASIEAARAGEMGRGFAVVASEVGSLAENSMEASKTTADLIMNSLEAVEKGMALSRETDRVLQEVVGKIEEVSDSISNISQASVEQSDAINQVMDGVEQISAVIEENSAMAQESSASAQELAEQSLVLNELIGAFKI